VQDGVRHAWLQTPVPEPASLALMLAGVAALGLRRRVTAREIGFGA